MLFGFLRLFPFLQLIYKTNINNFEIMSSYSIIYIKQDWFLPWFWRLVTRSCTFQWHTKVLPQYPRRIREREGERNSTVVTWFPFFRSQASPSSWSSPEERNIANVVRFKDLSDLSSKELWANLYKKRGQRQWLKKKLDSKTSPTSLHCRLDGRRIFRQTDHREARGSPSLLPTRNYSAIRILLYGFRMMKV